MLKTISSEDVDAFHATFPAYHAYIVEHHGQTYLPHYLGLYRVTADDKETYFLVMRNIFASSFVPQRIYDIKGSTVDRTASDKELAKNMPVFKDNDFRERGEALHIGANRATLMETIRRDIAFLETQRLMDYSLLLGIYDPADGQPATGGPSPSPEQDVFVVGTPEIGKQVVSLGLIDALTKYGAKKMAAHMAKGMKHGPGAEISTVNPEQYARRLLESLDAILQE